MTDKKKVATANEEVLPGSSSIIPYTNPRYPNHTLLSERLKTFNNWPTHYPQSSENLAKAGFFYTGNISIKYH